MKTVIVVVSFFTLFYNIHRRDKVNREEEAKKVFIFSNRKVRKESHKLSKLVKKVGQQQWEKEK
jgi:hypothetical protein